jgi:diadenosine tetraphosphate (Ap4A) HIT family hydrolase
MMPGMEGCVLCGPLAGEVRTGDYWRVAVNRNQNLLGKTIIVLRRHLERVAELTEEEWSELQAELRAVTLRLDEAFAPDH